MKVTTIPFQDLSMTADAILKRTENIIVAETGKITETLKL